MTTTSETIHDSTGRALEVRRPNGREQMRLMRICGPAADIDRYFGSAMIALCVRAIDSVPVVFPQTVDQVDVLVDRVGPEGAEAIAEWLANQTAKTRSETVAEAKN